MILKGFTFLLNFNVAFFLGSLLFLKMSNLQSMLDVGAQPSGGDDRSQWSAARASEQPSKDGLRILGFSGLFSWLCPRLVSPMQKQPLDSIAVIAMLTKWQVSHAVIVLHIYGLYWYHIYGFDNLSMNYMYQWNIRMTWFPKYWRIVEIRWILPFSLIVINIIFKFM